MKQLSGFRLPVFLFLVCFLTFLFSPCYSKNDLEHSNWFSRVQENIRRMEYEINKQVVKENGSEQIRYHAVNREQNLRMYFYHEGVKFMPRDKSEFSPPFEMGLMRVEGSAESVGLKSPELTSKNNVMKYEWPRVKETFENIPEGIRHVIKIESSPSGKDRLNLEFNFTGVSKFLVEGKKALQIFAKNGLVLCYGDIIVQDKTGKMIPIEIKITDSGASFEISDAGASYPVTIQGNITGISYRANWMAESNQNFPYFGWSIDSAGDVNGDGFDDIIVGAHHYQDCQTREGNVFVWYGSASGLGANSNPFNANWRGQIDQELSEFGRSVASAGDINGDGYDDIIVGAPSYNNGEESEGAAFAWYGSNQGLDVDGTFENADWKVESNSVHAQMGYSVAGAGDVNKDGYDDVLVGAYYYGGNDDYRGRMYLYYGSDCGLSTTPGWYAEGELNMYLGRCVKGAGDVNGDGYDDIMASIPGYEIPGQGRGGVAVWYGGDFDPETPGSIYNADHIIESYWESGSFGSSLAPAGDVNGDGFDDVITSAYRVSGDQNYEGAAFLYLGSPDGLSPNFAWLAEGNFEFSYFGYALDCAGDLNHDGYDDVIIGAYGYDDRGAAYLFHGRPEGLSESPDMQILNYPQESYFGISVSGAGDVNGDGVPDFMIGDTMFDNGESDEGAVFLYHGPGGDWVVEGNKRLAALGTSVASAGDIDRNGYSDVIIGAPGYDNGEYNEGRAFVYMGSSRGLNDEPSWYAESNVENAYFGSSVSTAGDVNGDGCSDILVGAENYGVGYSYQGAAYLWFGNVKGLGDSGSADYAHWKVFGSQNYAYLGRSVGTAGDVNNDGFSDIIITAPQYSHGESDEGVALIWYGSDPYPYGDKTPEDADVILEPDQANAFFGQSAGLAGDVNGDGISDIIVGAPFMGSGRAYLYYGASGGMDAVSDDMVESSMAGSSFGVCVATAGDVNSDGFADVIIGSPTYGSGAAFVYYGSNTKWSEEPDWEASSMQSNSGFGKSVFTAGDFNGDGYCDVIVGADRYKIGTKDEGAAFLWLGSGSGLREYASSSDPDILLKGNQVNSMFGASVAPAGDVNGDGFSDVIIGAPNFGNTENSEGAAFVFYGAGLNPADEPDWVADGPHDECNFGMKVASAGDVNGDGFSDIIIGAKDFDNGHHQEGAAFVYLGSENGPSTSFDWMSQSNLENCNWGNSVASAGDVNGDGYSDIIIGAPRYSEGDTLEGAAFVFYGSPSGLGVNGTPGNADWSAVIGGTQCFFGWSVACAGDVNGDGYADVAVGAYGYSKNHTAAGIAMAWYGSAAGMGENGTFANADWKFEGDREYAMVGHSVASAGDVNRDGYSDLIAGAPRFADGEENEGAIFLFNGTSGGLEIHPRWMAESNKPDARLGTSVASAGDVNGDGCADIIAGAPSYPVGRGSGTVFGWYGKPFGFGPDGSPENADWQAMTGDIQNEMGYSVAGAGDVNGDGYADIIVGEYKYTKTIPQRGRVHLFPGSPKGLESHSSWSISGEKENERLGESVASAGDVNGDGLADLIIGAPSRVEGTSAVGKVSIFYGNRGGSTLLPRQIRLNASQPISPLCLSDDQHSFRISASVPSTPSGRGKVKLECECRPLRVPLTRDETRKTPEWIQTQTTDTVTLEYTFEDLQAGPAMHWDMRLLYNPVTSPYQTHSRWFKIPHGGYQEADLRTAAAPALLTFEELKDLILGRFFLAPGNLWSADFNNDGIVDAGDLLEYMWIYSKSWYNSSQKFCPIEHQTSQARDLD